MKRPLERTGLVSPLCWTGGKFVAARRILAAFPPPETYGTYVEVFGGAAHVLVQKPTGKHLEVYNDLNGDLVHFWMIARDQAAALQQRIETLPFSRAVYHTYRDSLKNQEPMDDLERAARWFYVLRSTFAGCSNLSKGWGYTISQGNSKARSLRSATALLAEVAERFRYVQIEQQDFATLIQVYQTPRTLFYCDPPYIGSETYYTAADMAPFTQADHERLAELLNTTPALVALSYYEHPLLDELYPSSHWRRITWTQAKAAERTRERRQYGQEVLILNYPESLGGLWQESAIPDIPPDVHISAMAEEVISA
jgi:DNA adenine methylase